MLPVGVFKALVSKVNFKKETFIPKRYQEPIKLIGNTGIFFSGVIFYPICPKEGDCCFAQRLENIQKT